jgi:hypothetical protein
MDRSMSSQPYGSLAWARRTRGHVTRAEMLGEALSGLRTMLANQPKAWLHALGLLGRASQQLLDEVPLPRSPAALAASAEMQRCSPAFLAGHCQRSYSLAWMLGRVRGLACDAELLYVAAMLHDLPLTEPYLFPSGDSDCFALDGANLAGTFLRERGWAEARVLSVQEAICLHVNMQVPLELGVEAHLLNAGAACDLTGLGLPSLARGDIERLVSAHPRAGLARGFAALMDQQVARRPACRAHVLQSLGFARLMAAAPFPKSRSQRAGSSGSSSSERHNIT